MPLFREGRNRGSAYTKTLGLERFCERNCKEPHTVRKSGRRGGRTWISQDKDLGFGFGCKYNKKL